MRTTVIDLFAGPGGLGEGFASLNEGQSFSIAVSAEMDAGAHATLLLRSFFRHAKLQGDEHALTAYYNFCASAASHPKDVCPKLWAVAEHEARQLTLGEKKSNAVLDLVLAGARLKGDNSVLIGGPPCQAYSLVGRARNKGTSTYVPEKDHRHFLYKEYLRILAKVQPAVFVMENVKGILSSNVGGRGVFADILTDLSNPLKATQKKGGPKYKIYSLARPSFFEAGMDVEGFDPRDFIVRAEEYGVPQARHRVILLGVREDLTPEYHPLLAPNFEVTVRDGIGDLPKLRSRLSKGDSARKWHETVKEQGLRLAKQADARDPRLAAALRTSVAVLGENLPSGDLRLEMTWPRKALKDSLIALGDNRLRHWLNHEARSHMESDLGRYLYAAAFAREYRYSPKGHAEFNLKGLAPAHANWKSGKFADRFRVQLYGAPSTTVTSHIAKDGHYFIHPDPSQCRSLTVREAARLQTFPDNYFFQGTRTQQYHQVGNAVPPLLASQIADIVDRIVTGQQGEQAQQSRYRALAR